MPDEPTPTDQATPEDAEPPAPAPTNIEELQALKAREGNQAAKEQAVRQLLTVLDPHPNDQALAYAEVLGRLENVIARELQQVGG